MVVDEGEASLVDELPSAQLMDKEEVVEINLDQLEELMAQAMEENSLDGSDLADRHDVAAEITALQEEEDLDEEIELDEDINDLLEEEDLEEEIDIEESELMEIIKNVLSEELGPDLKDEETVEEGADTSAASVDTLEEVEDLEEEKKPDFPDVDGDGDTKEPISKAQKDKKEKEGGEDKKDKDYSKVPPQLRKHMQKESRLLQKENKTLLREQTKMNNKVQLLENKVQKYGTVIEQLKEKLDKSNLSNAKLLYQNRILNSISLNERQKDKIVEAISNATTVEEAKIIFETLQSAVGLKSKKTRKQESLDEVVTRSSSAFIPRKEVKPNTDAFSDRMKRLAGLK